MGGPTDFTTRTLSRADMQAEIDRLRKQVLQLSLKGGGGRPEDQRAQQRLEAMVAGLQDRLRESESVAEHLVGQRHDLEQQVTHLEGRLADAADLQRYVREGGVRWVDPHGIQGRPYQEPELSSRYQASLFRDLHKRGIVTPLVIDQHKRVIDGERRFQFAISVGVQRLPIVVTDHDWFEGPLECETLRCRLQGVRPGGTALAYRIAHLADTCRGSAPDRFHYEPHSRSRPPLGKESLVTWLGSVFAVTAPVIRKALRPVSEAGAIHGDDLDESYRQQTRKALEDLLKRSPGTKATKAIEAALQSAIESVKTSGR